MKIGIIGSGAVAQALGLGFVGRGHEAKLGSRSPEKLEGWLSEAGRGASAGTMEEAATFGELLVLACKGTETESAIEAAGPEHLRGKVLIDVTNPLVPSDEGLPRLAYGPADSGGEVVQRALPDTRVVKTLNIVNNSQMVDPEAEGGPPTMLVAGDDAEAKRQVAGILDDFGWEDVVDIGGIEASRELESLCVLWVRYALPNDARHAVFRLLR